MIVQAGSRSVTQDLQNFLQLTTEYQSKPRKCYPDDGLILIDSINYFSAQVNWKESKPSQLERGLELHLASTKFFKKNPTVLGKSQSFTPSQVTMHKNIK
ncbi:hypothetical protein GE061_001230 [Apolygus lucorum]|uniref:Uncharacterized protein n=1 Tax=Apolygus lucorum TaxID=248454 RepID=A0A8S9Y6H1_APOLU|nr:hypothetical protein GE061_001230 [Apolygus lucorum]